MIEAAVPIVEITSDPIWAYLMTGAVGIAGVIGTFWQGKRSREAQSRDLRASIDAAAENLRRSIAAEDDRANEAEKRRIYAKCMATFTAAIEATVRAGKYGDLEPPIEAEDEVVRTQFAASAASWEVSLTRIRE